MWSRNGNWKGNLPSCKPRLTCGPATRSNGRKLARFSCSTRWLRWSTARSWTFPIRPHSELSPSFCFSGSICEPLCCTSVEVRRTCGSCSDKVWTLEFFSNLYCIKAVLLVPKVSFKSSLAGALALSDSSDDVSTENVQSNFNLKAFSSFFESYSRLHSAFPSIIPSFNWSWSFRSFCASNCLFNSFSRLVDSISRLCSLPLISSWLKMLRAGLSELSSLDIEYYWKKVDNKNVAKVSISMIAGSFYEVYETKFNLFSVKQACCKERLLDDELYTP